MRSHLPSPSPSQILLSCWDHTLAFLERPILGDLLFALFFFVVLCLFSVSFTLSILVGFIYFPQISHQQHAICVVLNHTVIRDCSNTSAGKGFRRAYLVDIWAQNASQGQMLNAVEPWYTSETLAISQLPTLPSLGSKRSCIYDPVTLFLTDAIYASAQDGIVAWAIVVSLFLICFFLTISCTLLLKRSPARQLVLD